MLGTLLVCGVPCRVFAARVLFFSASTAVTSLQIENAAPSILPPPHATQISYTACVWIGSLFTARVPRRPRLGWLDAAGSVLAGCTQRAAFHYHPFQPISITGSSTITRRAYP